MKRARTPLEAVSAPLKALFLMLALLLVLAVLAAPVAFAGVPGDYNGDGAVDDADKQIILDARNTVEGDEGFVPAADHNGDGVISLVDVSAFAKIYRAQN